MGLFPIKVLKPPARSITPSVLISVLILRSLSASVPCFVLQTSVEHDRTVHVHHAVMVHVYDPSASADRDIRHFVQSKAKGEMNTDDSESKRGLSGMVA